MQDHSATQAAAHQKLLANNCCSRTQRRRIVLSPHVPASGAAVAADREQKGRGSQAERLVRQLPDHGVTRGTFTAAAPAPLIGPEDLALQYGPVGLEALPHDFEAETIQTAERGQGR